MGIKKVRVVDALAYIGILHVPPEQVDPANTAGYRVTDSLVLHCCPARSGSKLRKYKRYVFSALAPGFASDLLPLVEPFATTVGKSIIDKALIIVNPISGHKKGAAVYDEVIPMFQAAAVHVTSLETSYAGHARDFVSSIDLKSYDVIVCVGGDGTLHEVVTGLWGRSDGEVARLLTVATIPAGSEGAFARATTHMDPVTAAFHILKAHEIRYGLPAPWAPPACACACVGPRELGRGWLRRVAVPCPTRIVMRTDLFR